MNANAPAAEILHAFAVPMAVVRLAEQEVLNRRLRELFLEREAKGDLYANPEPRVKRNRTLFESRFDLFEWPEACVQELKNFCLGQLYQLFGSLNGYQPQQLQQMHFGLEAWFHITRGGGYFAAHNHPNHSWSGVDCVQHDGDDPDSDSGKLCFLNPNLASNMYVDAANVRLQRPFSGAPLRFRLEPGQLVLFPSWLLHEVMPYEGNSERITVAFNARFRYTGSDIL